MKRADAKDRGSVLYIGKGIIILSLIVTSSLSFILGFFVGKRYNPFSENRISALQLQESNTDREEGSSQAVPQFQQQVEQHPDGANPATPQEIQKPPQSAKIEDLKTGNGKDQQQAIALHKEQKQSSHAQLAKNSLKPTKENTSSSKTDKPKEFSKSRKYFVQAGAFRNAAEAESLQGKLLEKGYKSIVITAKTKKKETLFKVMVGEFINRKDAELLSLKLKKTEGLKPFVTFSQ